MVLVLNNCAEIYCQDCDYFWTEVKRKRMPILMNGEHEVFQFSSLFLDGEDYKRIHLLELLKRPEKPNLPTHFQLV